MLQRMAVHQVASRLPSANRKTRCIGAVQNPETVEGAVHGERGIPGPVDERNVAQLPGSPSLT